MYLACTTWARMLGADTTHLRGAARSDSLPACEVDQNCQYHQPGFHMLVAMPKKIRTCQHKCLPAVNSGRMAPQVRACWDPSLRVLVGPACQRSLAVACQSLLGPFSESFGGSDMPEICGGRMSEPGGTHV